MVGAELRPPYDRPPLTKKFMTGQLDDTTLAADPAALGLDLRLDEAATGVDGGVLRTDRAEYPFDALVVATGAAPVGLPGGGRQRFLRTFGAFGVRRQVGWLSGAPVRLESGVAVDGRLRASAPGVYAAGDCAAFASTRYGRRLRVEHWDNALHAPRVVAANVLGGDETY